MSDRKMQQGLRHKYAGMGDEAFFKMIEETGGWPLGFKYVGFEHTDERDAGFTNSPRNDGWWTVVYTSDDYYMWKLSPEAIQRIAAAAIERCARVVATTKRDGLTVKNSRGYAGSLQKEGGNV